jgi:hypothetical protein
VIKNNLACEIRAKLKIGPGACVGPPILNFSGAALISFINIMMRHPGVAKIGFVRSLTTL